MAKEVMERVMRSCPACVHNVGVGPGNTPYFLVHIVSEFSISPREDQDVSYIGEITTSTRPHGAWGKSNNRSGIWLVDFCTFRVDVISC